MSRKKRIRKIHINEEVWIYYYGEGDNIIISSPKKKRYVISQSKLLGISYREWKEAMWIPAPYREGVAESTLSTGPGDIKKYIINNIIEKEKK